MLTDKVDNNVGVLDSSPDAVVVLELERAEQNLTEVSNNLNNKVNNNRINNKGGGALQRIDSIILYRVLLALLFEIEG